MYWSIAAPGSPSSSDQEQVDKVIEIQDRLHQFEHMIYVDQRGLRKYDHHQLHRYVDVQEQGRAAHDEFIEDLKARRAKLDYDSTCVMLYTSGTTGKPKGVVLSNRNIIETLEILGRLRPPDAGRGDPGLSADGLGRRFHLLDRPGLLVRVLRELPGKRRHDDDRPARDRADLLFRAAAGLRDPADQRDDPDGGCRPAEEADVRSLHGPCPQGRPGHSRRQAGERRGPAEVRSSATCWSTGR